jgi:AraC-like DNA-binding protein
MLTRSETKSTQPEVINDLFDVSAKPGYTEGYTEDILLKDSLSATVDESKPWLQVSTREIAFENVRLRWFKYNTARKETIRVDSEGSAIELHFRLTGSSTTESDDFSLTMRDRQNSIFYTEKFSAEHSIVPDKNNTASFFEVKLSPQLFEEVWLHDKLLFGGSFREAIGNHENSWIGRIMPISPGMLGLIRDMEQCSFRDSMKKLYLESKLVELMVLQAEGFEKKSDHPQRRSLKSADIERLYAAKEYIDLHFDQPCSIISIAQQVGVNQQKLKTGFRELFSNTVFGYLSDIRMEEAKRLLLEEKMYVNEVADRIGYKHPHHFTAAFKRKFGFVPKDLKK